MHHPVDNDDEKALELAISYLQQSRRVAVLTGAGVSAESGVATFRGAGGLWEGHNIEDVATPEAFQRDPNLVWRFYNLRRENLGAVHPNPGHYALAQLEQRFDSQNFALITQNIDGLHRAAGSQNIFELHGNLRRVRCSRCPYVEDRGLEKLDDLPACPDCGQLLRPDVVWFGEMLPQDTWMAAEIAVKECDCFLVIGTSAIVYPAAGLILLARDFEAKVIEINMERTPASTVVDVGLYGPSGRILPQLVTDV